MMEQKRILRYFIFLVIALFTMLPMASALEISNVQTVQITDTSALITWDTDEASDSFVSFGETKTTLEKQGDSTLSISHKFPLTNLKEKTKYFFSVESGGFSDDKEGSLYSFTTTEPDTDAPKIDVTFPEIIAGNKLKISGSTEIGAQLTIYVNGNQADTTIASKKDGLKYPGEFIFSNVALQNNQENTIKIEVSDAAGNKESAQGKVTSDTSKPEITFGKVPSLVATANLKFKAQISEKAKFEVFVNYKTTSKGDGKVIEVSLPLKEGKNYVKVTAKDNAGWETFREFSIQSDTKAPTVKFKIEKGSEYYQGTAESRISGTTEAGAKVFLYIYRPTTIEFSPDFSRAWAQTTANENGEFSFDDVNFESRPISLKSLAPKKIPQGLQKFVFPPTSQTANRDRFTSHIFVIAEDQTGKTGHQQSTVQINTCFSTGGSNVFEVSSMTQFQAPLALNPTLLDEGREVATAVYNFTYHGSATPLVDATTGNEIEPAFRITNVQVERACTQGMLKDDSSKLGCNIMPRVPKPNIPNNDKTAWYMSFNLNSADKLSKKKTSYWDEFLKRQVVFPMKFRITYQERETKTTGSPGANLVSSTKTKAYYGATKTQVSCQTLGYFVDVPVDSADLIPDFIADEGLDAVRFTSEKIEAILPYLENTILVTGAGCMTSFLGRTTLRVARQFSAKMEYFSSQAKIAAGTQKKEEACPLDQENLILEDTRKEWDKIKSSFAGKTNPSARLPNWNVQENTLDTRCPRTAKLWKAEELFDTTYKWACDRVFCRAAPAAWTATKEKKEVDTVILKQQQCTVTSRGIPLQKVENCQNQLTKDVRITTSKKAATLKLKGTFTCYRNQLNNQLYYIEPGKLRTSGDGAFVTLEWLSPVAGLELKSSFDYAKGFGSNLLAYKPKGTDEIIVGTEQSCASVCEDPRAPGFKADKEKSVSNVGKKGETSKQNGCYKEVKDSFGKIDLVGGMGKIKGSTTRPAGYTSDCFVDINEDGTQKTKSAGETGLLQCVCTSDVKAKTENLANAREAIKEDPDTGTSEEWSYRQDQLYKTNPAKGTFYPKWRYYSGRDTSATFGLNHVLDVSGGSIAKINPNSQHLGAFQSMCLSGIHARLRILNGILKGVDSCISEAKTSEFKDAGVCKTLFSQQICGLAYKATAYLTNSCQPLDFNDELKKSATLDTLGEASNAFSSSVSSALDSSVRDITSDYTNANLQEFFSGGAQGFAQSMCMGAFGYDMPLGMDFILDSAYAFPMKTTAHALPRERQFASFDPVHGTAIYNYDIGALVLPGCKIQNANVYLKCVGQEDLNRPGVQCGEQECDCLRTTQKSASGERIKYLDGASMFNLKAHDPVSLKIKSPQKINSNFRYDHVVVDLKLAPNENPDTCFDEGYKDGKFFFPLVDTSPSGVTAACQAQLGTGKFFCSEIQSLFSGGGTYFEDPYFTCYNKNTQSWASCDTPNLFTEGDLIRVKTHVASDGQSACLRVTDSGLVPGAPRPRPARPLPQNLPGSHSPEFTFDKVSPVLFNGASNSLALRTAESDSTCNRYFTYDVVPPTQIKTAPTFRFNYAILAGGLYKVTVEDGVGIHPSSTRFKIENKVLKKKTGEEGLTSGELLTVPFTFEGFTVRGLIGAATGTKKQCVYQVRGSASKQYASNQKSFRLTAEILQPDANGQCFSANRLMKAPVYGKSRVSIDIPIQLNPLKSQVITQMHDDFMSGNCRGVQEKVTSVINRRLGDLEDATALYYGTACYVQQGQSTWQTTYQPQVCTLWDIFDKRRYANGDTAPAYKPEVMSKEEFKKVSEYLKWIASKAKCAGAPNVIGPSPPQPGTPNPSISTPTLAPTTCGNSIAKFKPNIFASGQPQGWNKYTCRQPTAQETSSSNNIPGSPDPNPQCWSAGMYSTKSIATANHVAYGCPGVQLCCPAR